MDIQTLATCDAAYTADGANPGSIGTGNVCAGLPGSRPCYYDVGGPLTTMEGNQHKLVGAVSSGICQIVSQLKCIYFQLGKNRKIEIGLGEAAK